MERPRELLTRLAALLEYPGDDYRERVSALRTAIDEAGHVEATAPLARFDAWAEPLQTWQLEEAFVQAFDGNKDRALEIGWHLYGENYQRGMFIVEMRGELARLGLPESTELPDHATHVLQVIAHGDGKLANRLIRMALVPAVTAIEAALRQKGSPFADLLATVQGVLAGAGVERPSPSTRSSSVGPPLTAADGRRAAATRQRAEEMTR